MTYYVDALTMVKDANGKKEHLGKDTNDGLAFSSPLLTIKRAMELSNGGENQ